jgi:CHAT domain-containing protein
VGVSKGWGDFPALAAVPEELRRIIRQEKESTGVVPGRRLMDKDFTKEALERALGRYSVIHIASHFSFQPGDQKSSYLLLGDGTPFTIEAVENPTPMFTSVDLLALSACNTALGGDTNGREVEGFGALAQQHGALSVLATLWAVADESTTRLMSDFYRRLTMTAGQAKGEALRQAQLEMMRGAGIGAGLTNRSSKLVGTESSAASTFKPDAKHPVHPYYWAPFILIGNWR